MKKIGCKKGDKVSPATNPFSLGMIRLNVTSSGTKRSEWESESKDLKG